MLKPAVVIIAYNREKPLKRLLDSINAADYPDKDVTLVISVDLAKNEAGDAVRKAAEAFDWKHGEKKLLFREENLGLKKHVLSCGDLSTEYGAVILLEDDLYVSPDYYQFAAQALAFSEQDEKIGGISLYDHRLNVHAREPFEAIHEPYDNWYFQLASSWGQAFSAAQWQGFRTWLAEHDGEDLRDINMPQNVSGWSDRSWLKYCIKYLIETDRYFLYPAVSHTTNFSDEGTHAKEAVTDLQVPLSGKRSGQPFAFIALADSKSVYDAFFENCRLKQQIASVIRKLTGGETQEKEITVDLYGYRKDLNTRYVLSSQALPYRRLKGYARQLRPHDANVFLELEGNDFYLYDRDAKAEPPKMNGARKLLYDHRAIRVSQMIRIALFRLKQRL